MISRLLLLAFPASEIYLFVYISNLTSGWITILLILSSTILGLVILRTQGRHIANRLRQNLINKGFKIENIANEMIFALAGLLLIIPGFITDSVGLLLLIPIIRQLILRTLIIIAKSPKKKNYTSQRETSDGPIIEGNYEDISKKDDSEKDDSTIDKQ